MQKRPIRAMLFIVASAIVLNFFDVLSSAYVKNLKTRNIMLATAEQSRIAGMRQDSPTNSPESPRKANIKNNFIAIPARAALAGGRAAGEIAAIERSGAPAIAERPPGAGKQNWQNSLGRNKLDSANLAPGPLNGTTASSPFVYKIDRPLWPSSNIVILLHGSGGDETTLLPFARPIWPRATLIGIRGRIMQGSERRWYHKITPTSFNQKEAQQEADSLAQFILNLVYEKHYAPKKLIFVGYSNGANILAIMSMKYPQLVHRAILLRPMPVLDAMPQEDLHNLQILTLSGARDRLYGGFAEPLYSSLQQNGAHVTGYRIAATHMLGREDAKTITRWLKLGY